jgi:hypothetical protein
MHGKYVITRQGNITLAEGKNLQMTVEGDGGSAFSRVGILNACTPAAEEVRWLVGELDGVRVYLFRDTDGSLDVLLTKRDVYPTEKSPK